MPPWSQGILFLGFLGLLTVCGLGWLKMTFRNSLSVPSSRVNYNDSERMDTNQQKGELGAFPSLFSNFCVCPHHWAD